MKPIEVWSTHGFVNILRTKPKRCATKLVVKKKGRVNGRSKLLRKSQAYPRLFGKKVAKVFKAIKNLKS